MHVIICATSNYSSRITFEFAGCRIWMCVFQLQDGISLLCWASFFPQKELFRFSLWMVFGGPNSELQKFPRLRFPLPPRLSSNETGQVGRWARNM